MGLEYLQRRRLHNLPGQPGPGLRHPQREEVLPHLHLELPLLQFVPIKRQAAPFGLTPASDQLKAIINLQPKPTHVALALHRPMQTSFIFKKQLPLGSSVSHRVSLSASVRGKGDLLQAMSGHRFSSCLTCCCRKLRLDHASARLHESSNHRIIGWKRPLRSSCPTIHPTPPCLTNHILKCHIHIFF